MHTFHQHVSRMFQDAAVERLRSITHTNDYYMTMERTTRTIASILMDILRQLYNFMEVISLYSDETQIFRYIRNRDGLQRLNDVFTVGGLVDMYDAADIKN